MQVLALTGGPLATNGYLIADEKAREAAMVDPPHDISDRVTSEIEARGWRLVLIINTHGHWDHVGGNAGIREATGTRIAAHALEVESIRRPGPLGMLWGIETKGTEVDQLLSDGSIIRIGAMELTVMHTPGHSPGSICLYTPLGGGYLASGDTLFDGACGRTDLPGGDEGKMAASLALLAGLPPGTRVYPGHGPDTRIGDQIWLRRPPGG